MLIIFDCDGVLVDSEQLAAEVFSTELRLYGVSWTANECRRRFRGHTLTYCFELLQDCLPDPLPNNFLEGLQESTRQAFESSLKAVDGVRPILELLQKRNIPFCVASNGNYEKMKHALRITGLYSFFENRCYSAEAVTEGKPAPDLFLFAAESLGVSPRFCCVIEDSVVGLQAATAAGMRPLHFDAWGVEAESTYKGVYPSFNRMSLLPELLGIR